MLNQAATDRVELAKLLSISDTQMSYITNVGAGQGLLKPNGEPNQAFFLTDGIHMSLAGYAIWGKFIKDRIIADMKKNA